MSDQDRQHELDDAIRVCFLPQVSFLPLGEPRTDLRYSVTYTRIRPTSGTLEDLRNDTLPYLALPEVNGGHSIGTSRLALVAVEGRDTKMAGAIAELLDPAVVGLGLMHITWLPRMISSPLDRHGLDNPEPADLLAYHGAREALVDTASALRQSGFEVSTHLREDRDPAAPLASAIQEQKPDLFVLGLGRHGAGIGRRVLEEAPIPVLYVRAR